jgi:DNA-directed RNA polymerase specialized sigma24 family protein
MSDIVRIKSRVRRQRRASKLDDARTTILAGERREYRALADANWVTTTRQTGESSFMSAPAAGSIRASVDPRPVMRVNGDRASAALDASVDFERYREAACSRFVAMARTMGHHAFHDLDELAKDFYDDFWTEWLARPHRQLSGSPVSYIAGAMMNKLRDLSRRGRSVRAPELVRSDGEEILATVAAEDLDPAEQVVLQEEMWLVSDIVHTLPQREQVVFAAVFGRDSKRKDAPPAGYKLAAAQLGVSERTAKKLSLMANRRIRAAVEQIESGRWCDRWAASIESVAAGENGEAEFLRHAEHCVQCRMGVVHLRRQAAVLPLPVLLGAHAGLLGRVWDQLAGTFRSARDQAVGVLGRHATTASDAGGIVGTGGGAAGAGVTAIKLGAVCLGVAATGAGASVCLQAAGLSSPIIAAVVGSHHASRHRPPHHSGAHTARATPIAAPAIVALSTTTSASVTSTARPPRSRRGSTGSRSAAAHSASASRSASAAQKEFSPGGGSGSQVATSGSESQVSADSSSATTASSTPSSTSSTSSPTSKKPSGGGTVTSGSSNPFTAP